MSKSATQKRLSFFILSLTVDFTEVKNPPEKSHIQEIVSFKIGSEASYVYILSGQKLIKSAKNGQIGEFLKNWSLWSNSVTR